MPIYEYACRGCGRQFEAIVQSSTVPECPECKSTELDKQLSVFAVGGSSNASFEPAPAGCGGCSDRRPDGSCGLN
ncbi:MAG: zinc ribbon domain-containing protein [Myxococcota bacterium]